METTALGKLETKVDGVDAKVDALVIQVTQLNASSMQRAEIEAADSRRVLVETYVSDQRSIGERLARLEGGPLRILAYLGAGTGCLGILISVVGVLFGVITWIALHYK